MSTCSLLHSVAFDAPPKPISRQDDQLRAKWHGSPERENKSLGRVLTPFQGGGIIAESSTRSRAKVATLPNKADWQSCPNELFLRGFVAVGDIVPIKGVPPGGDVIGPFVLILEVIGVLPNVQAEERCIAVHDRTVLIRSRSNG